MGKSCYMGSSVILLSCVLQLLCQGSFYYVGKSCHVDKSYDVILFCPSSSLSGKLLLCSHLHSSLLDNS